MDVEKTVKDVIEEFIDKVDTSIRRVVEKIQGTWDYMKFIWSHDCYREWDYEYLYNLILFKLNRMEKQIREDNFVEDSCKNADNILRAINCYKIHKEAHDKYLLDTSYYNNKVITMVNIIERSSWDMFHDILKKEAKKWWS